MEYASPQALHTAISNAKGSFPAGRKEFDMAFLLELGLANTFNEVPVRRGVMYVWNVRGDVGVECVELCVNKGFNLVWDDGVEECAFWVFYERASKGRFSSYAEPQRPCRHKSMCIRTRIALSLTSSLLSLLSLPVQSFDGSSCATSWASACAAAAPS